jgi:Formate hydrogenlyase subunit 4
MIAYEPILVMLSVAFYIQNGSFSIEAVRANPSALGSLFFLFLAFLFVVQLKLKKSPFDAAKAHQEIVGGAEVEFSGLFFEFVYMALWLEYVFVYLLLLLFAGNNVLLGALLFGVVFLLVNLVDNATARVRMEHLIKIFLGIAVSLAALNLLGLSYV